MGKVIRGTAAVNDILSDVRTASTGAQAAGGLFQTSYKRLLKANNISEAKIHESIPDRPSQAQPRTPAPPAPSSP